MGWKAVGITNYPQKCIICVAPHTSNWDLPTGWVISRSLGKHSNFLIKKDWFFFPMNLIFSAIGGIPVDRSKKTSMTKQLADEFQKRKSLQIAVTPEGTRQPNSEWKKGFYYIALAAEVPIVVAALDYKKKEADFKKVISPSGNIETDLAEIKSCYLGVTAKHPEKFLL